MQQTPHPHTFTDMVNKERNYGVGFAQIRVAKTERYGRATGGRRRINASTNKEFARCAGRQPFISS